MTIFFLIFFPDEFFFFSKILIVFPPPPSFPRWWPHYFFSHYFFPHYFSCSFFFLFIFFLIIIFSHIFFFSLIIPASSPPPGSDSRSEGSRDGHLVPNRHRDPPRLLLRERVPAAAAGMGQLSAEGVCRCQAVAAGMYKPCYWLKWIACYWYVLHFF